MRALIILDDDSTTIAALLALLRDHALIPQSIALPEEGAASDSTAILFYRAGLSARERQLVALDLQGLSRAEIADRLGLAPTTVKTYWKTIYSKLGISRRSQLRAWLSVQQLRPATPQERAVGGDTPMRGADYPPVVDS